MTALEQGREDYTPLLEEWERRGLNRRHFLRLLLAGASTATIAGVLAACGDATPTAGVGTTGGAATGMTTTTAAGTTSAAGTTAASTTAAAAAATATSGPGAGAIRVGSPSASPIGSPVAGQVDYPGAGKFSTLEPVGKPGGLIIEVSFADGKTTNPMLSSDSASASYIAMMFTPVIGVNPDTGLPFANLATKVPTRENGLVSPDGLTYTFPLRNDVKWHDGRPFTAADVKFTYETMMNKALGSPRTSELVDRIESVTTPDDYTAVFKLKKVVAPFLVDNMVYGVVPKHILEKVSVNDIKTHPFSTGSPQTIGTGPFKFKEWVKDDHFTVVRFDDYFRGKPALDEYVFKVVRDANVVVAQLKTGEADYGSVTESFYAELNQQPNLNLLKYDTYSFTYYAYQLDPTKTTLFQDKKVRQALAYGLDRQAMIKSIRFGIGEVATGTEPVLSWAYAPDKMNTTYSYNPQKAQQLLEEAGWTKGPDGIRTKDGRRLAFTLWTNAGNKVREQYVTVMQQFWKNIGVEATPKTEEWNAILTRITETHDFDMFLIGFGWGVDPDQSTMWQTDAYEGGFNMNKYSNERVDRILAEALSTLDQEKRKQLYIEMQNIIMDELPSFIMDFPQALVGVNKRIHNLKPNAINTRWNAHTWWVDNPGGR